MTNSSIYIDYKANDDFRRAELSIKRYDDGTEVVGRLVYAPVPSGGNPCHTR